MECPYCKAELRDGVRYCSRCGNLVTSPSAPLSPNSGSLPPGSGGLSSSLTAGTRLQGGRYVVKKALGQGGMGAALLANDIRLDNKLVVIKELISESVDRERRLEDVRNFKREVSTLAHIDHPLVPNVTDHFQEGMRYFMVQEYVEGENLEERLAATKQPLKERDALIWASDILDVLDYLSLQTPPIVHRDIKPSNIIIGAKDKRAHLVDFGIARAEAALNAQRKQTSALGTPGYAPPEQYQGNADPRSDLYALAATLHHVLTGRDPRRHPPFGYPPVRAFNAQLSPDVELLLTHALSNDINQRYQSASAMKKSNDAILSQRFGVIRSVDSYNLGPLDTEKQPPTGITAPTGGSISGTVYAPAQSSPSPISITPVYPLPGPNTPVGLFYPPAPPPQKQSRRRIWITLLLIFVVLFGAIGGAIFYWAHGLAGPIPTVTPTSAGGVGVSRVGDEYIGISDGTFAFDTTLDDGAIKTQAAQLLKEGKNTAAALTNYSRAVEKSSNDAESLIYMENLRVQNSGSPYITLVVATMLTGNKALVAVGRDNLQGAYVAQKEFNAGGLLQGGVQIRLLIANSGSRSEEVTNVAQQIVKLAHADKTFGGVMGWPYSGRSIAAVGVLGAAHIPMISQTASSDLLTRASPYFFRVVPSNNVQGVSGAKYAEQTLHASKAALFVDEQDAYSQSLAQDFIRQFTADGNRIIVQKKYTVGKPETLPASLQDALRKQPDMIYFSGYAGDLSTLLEKLPSGDLPIMGGDGLYELGGYPPSAANGFKHLRFTAFAYPDEWGILGYGDKQPGFFNEYIQDFNPHGEHPGGAYGFTRTDNDVMLSYDATVALLKGCNVVLSSDLALSSGKVSITPRDVQQALTTLHGSGSFQGVSGQIGFGSDGDPIDKVIVVLTVDSQGHIHMESVSSGRFLKG